MVQFDPDHGGVTDQDLEAYIQNRMGQSPLAPVVPGQIPTTPPFRAGQGAPPPPNFDETGGQTDAPSTPYQEPPSDVLEDDEEDEEDDDLDPTQDPEDEPDPDALPEVPLEIPPPIVPPTMPTINGRQVTAEELNALGELDTLLRYDPELRGLVQTHLQSRGGETSGAGVASQPTTPAPEVPQIPAELLEDPAILALYQQTQAQNQTIESLQQQVAQTTDVVMNRERQETDAIIRRVSQNFASEKQLSEEAVQQLGVTASRMNLLSPLMAGVDPITGAPVPQDREYAARRALEIAYWSVPEYRDKEYASQVKTRAKDQQRKQRLAGIGGSGGSVPRATPIPNTPHERRSAAVRDMAEMMGLTPQE